MEEALELVRAKDAKERMAGVERLHQVLESSRKGLSSAEVTALVELSMDLLKDANFRVSQGTLQTLSAAAVLAGEEFKLHFNGLVPAVVERLGDGKQPVRDAARQLLVTLMEVSSPTIVVERAGSYAWAHKSWRVREEFARVVATAIGLFASTELPLKRALLPHVLQLLNDLNYSVREVAILCVEEMYTQGGVQFHDELQSQNIPSSMMKEINARLAKIEPRAHSTDEHGSHLIPSEIKSFNVGQKRSSANGKNNPRGTLLSVGESDVTEKPVDPVKVYSEKELVREFEKIASTLVLEKDWSDRIAAMQRVEGLVFGGAVDYPSFPMVLKQLVIPLSSQLSDRRSSIVKQACHLLCLLSKELLGDFEACAEMFIPVLFKLVVITVLVIAESANNCIKTMLRNCKVARVLPRIADSAKNDRSAVLRARCCEYALLVLEYWADAPEIQRSADLYEDLIKCCAADAMSEVRSMARTCYRMFMKTWPDRSRRLFLSFDPAIQRIINEENGAMHKRFPSPLHERGGQLSHASSHVPHANSPGYGTSAIVAMDKTASIASGTSLSSSGQLVSQTKPTAKGAERSLESMLHASKQQVSAIETLLKGLNSSQKQISSAAHSDSLDQGLDPPSARNPPFPPAVTATSPLSIQSSAVSDLTINNIVRGTIRNNGSITDHSFPHGQPSRDLSKLYDGHLSSDSLSASSLPYTSRRRERLQEGGAIDDSNNIRSTRRFPSIQIDRQHSETHKDAGYRDSQNNYVPNFQRPLLRKQVLGRTSATGRSSFDDSQLSFGEMASYFDGPASLSDALSEGLSPSSDWIARVSAFNHLQTLLQQGPHGIYEVIQSFEKVMKLFFQHLDDPHHKVAQAALSTLAEIIPACRKPFESYIERILPHVFPRLIDQKESVRQPCSATLDIAGKNYNIDSLLPALLRSLDEQRSPKAKLAVIEFANKSFNKHRVHSNAYSNCGFLKLWLAKLVPIVNDKNSKLKEAAISGIIAVYTYFDSTSVLNFIISLSVDEQNCLRRALRQYTPRIEVDLINFLQNKKERQRAKSFSDYSDIIGTSSDEGYGVTLKKSHFFGRYSAGSVDDEGGRKWNFMQEMTQVSSSMGPANSVETQRQFYQNVTPSSDMEVAKSKDQNNITEGMVSRTNRVEMADHIVCGSPLATPRLDINRMMDSDGRKAHGWSSINSNIHDMELTFDKSTSIKSNHNADNGHSIPQLLHQISIRNDENTSSNKCAALQQLVEVSVVNNHSVWTKYFNQILTAVLGLLDDPDSSVKELALSLIIEMLNHQKAAMEDSVEIVTEKLIHATKDVVQKVSNDAHNCLTTILAHYDTFRCLAVVVPLLVNDDEKTLIVGINCLTKLVGRLSQEQLMTQLRSFLPALFDAFGNQNPDVRKAVVFCLVDIYIMLGKAFLPYLEGLNGKQLRLVTIYASRISQGRSVGVVQ